MKICPRCANTHNHNLVEKPNIDPLTLGFAPKYHTIFFIRGVRVEEVCYPKCEDGRRKCDWCRQPSRVFWRDNTPFLLRHPFTLMEYERLEPVLIKKIAI